MKCFAMQPDYDLLKRTAPKRILEDVKDDNKKTLILAGFEDMKMVCYAVFSQLDTSPREIWLEYIFTSALHREEGYASGLLSYASDYFKELGASCIICRMLANPINAGEFAEFFENRGYIPLTLTGRLLVYDYEDMLAPGVFQLLEKKKAALPPVLSYEKVKKMTLFKTIPIDILDGEEELSCFFADKSGVYGAAASYTPDDDTVVIREIYLEPEAEKKGLFLPILASVVEEAVKVLGEENMKLHIFLKNDTEYRGLMQVFNPPEEEYLVLEFIQNLKIAENEE